MSKYERPTGTYTGDSALANREKYQNDASAQPKVAISSSKMDGDFNYILDALNQIDLASGSRTSIQDRLSIALNEDGTLKASVVAALDDWVLDDLATGMSRVDDSTVTFNGDAEDLYMPHRRVRFIMNGEPVFASVKYAVHNAGVTTLSVRGIVDADGNSAIISVVPTAIAYAPMTTGATGNTSMYFDTVRLEDYSLQVNGGDLEILQNTGTDSAPVWAVRGRVTSSGFVLADASVSNAKIGANAVTFNKMSTTAIASQIEAETGTTIDKLMTPERTAQAISSLASGPAISYKKLNYNSVQDNSSSTYVVVNDSTLNFTPASTSSQLKVEICLPYETVGGAGTLIGVDIFRDGVSLGQTHGFYTSYADYKAGGTVAGFIVDEPNTISQVSYDIRFKRVTGSSYARIPKTANHTAYIMLTEY